MSIKNILECYPQVSCILFYKDKVVRYDHLAVRITFENGNDGQAIITNPTPERVTNIIKELIKRDKQWN